MILFKYEGNFETLNGLKQTIKCTITKYINLMES